MPAQPGEEPGVRPPDPSATTIQSTIRPVFVELRAQLVGRPTNAAAPVTDAPPTGIANGRRPSARRAGREPSIADSIS